MAGYGSETITGMSFIFNRFIEIIREERIGIPETAQLSPGQDGGNLGGISSDLKPSDEGNVLLREVNRVKELLI